MKCPHCGLDIIKPSYKFCPSCRKPVNNIVTEETRQREQTAPVSEPKSHEIGERKAFGDFFRRKPKQPEPITSPDLEVVKNKVVWNLNAGEIARRINIDEFDRLTAVTTYKYESDSEESNQFDQTAIIFYDLEGNQVLTADISAFLNARIAAQLTGSDTSDELTGEINLPDGSRLLITHCEARVEAEQKITWLKLDGVLLGKAEAQ